MPLPGLSPVAGKSVVAKFDGGLLSSDGGILVLREVEQRLRVADRMAACIEDPRAPDQEPLALQARVVQFREGQRSQESHGRLGIDQQSPANRSIAISVKPSTAAIALF